MATRAMVFIDGTWLAVTANRLADQYGLQGRTGGPLDFGALPRACAQAVAAQMGVHHGIDVVRTYYFGSIATNYDPQDADAVQRRSDFFDSLRRHHRYEVYRFETDFRGQRVRRAAGDEGGFTPPEKAVDVGLATALLEMAALSAYDIAIAVCGDRDFVPALQAVRRLGKRVAVVSARGSCARELSDPNDPMRVRDFEPLWLDQLWAQVVSPTARAEPEPTELPAATGVVTKVHANGYGFVRTDDGADHYFRRSDFTDPAEFVRLERFRTRLAFRVQEVARPGQAGRASALVITGESDPGPASFRATPGSVAVVGTSSADALWDVDPFAARPRRDAPGPMAGDAPGGGQPAAEAVSTAPSETELDAAPPAVEPISADDAPVPPPARKKRAPRKSPTA